MNHNQQTRTIPWLYFIPASLLIHTIILLTIKPYIPHTSTILPQTPANIPIPTFTAYLVQTPAAASIPSSPEKTEDPFTTGIPDIPEPDIELPAPKSPAASNKAPKSPAASNKAPKSPAASNKKSENFPNSPHDHPQPSATASPTGSDSPAIPMPNSQTSATDALHGNSNPHTSAIENANSSGNTAIGNANSSGNTAASENPPQKIDENLLWLEYTKNLWKHFKKHRTYPEMARRLNITGTVYVIIRIQNTGDILDTQIARSSGSDMLDKAALASITAGNPAPPFPTPLQRHPERRIKIPFKFQLK